LEVDFAKQSQKVSPTTSVRFSAGFFLASATMSIVMITQ
jgi:hypothetical protein